MASFLIYVEMASNIGLLFFKVVKGALQAKESLGFLNDVQVQYNACLNSILGL